MDKAEAKEPDSSSLVSSGTEDTIQAVPAPATAPQNLNKNQTLDIHTITALIGRENVDVSLGDLGLHHEAVNDVLNIYAVIRQLETEKTDEMEEDIAEERIQEDVDIGKNAIFRFDKKWVFLVHNQVLTERSYPQVTNKLREDMRVSYPH